MKNIHILPTDKPTIIFKSEIEPFLHLYNYDARYFLTGQNIYVTSDGEIKEGDYVYDSKDNVIRYVKKYLKDDWIKKIILTTDQDLIKDGVQAIDDTFLEWFVKNPSCEEVKVEKEKVILGEVAGTTYIDFNYKIIIPKEEQPCTKAVVNEAMKAVAKDIRAPKVVRDGIVKQETLEEASFRLFPRLINNPYFPFEDDNEEERDIWINGAEWQKQRSKQDLKDLWDFVNERCINHLDDELPQLGTFDGWFEQFKKN